jgi:hypothetical protein
MYRSFRALDSARARNSEGSKLRATRSPRTGRVACRSKLSACGASTDRADKRIAETRIQAQKVRPDAAVREQARAPIATRNRLPTPVYSAGEDRGMGVAPVLSDGRANVRSSSPKEKEMGEQQQPDRSKEHDRRNQQQQDEERRRREGISQKPSPSREDESESK